MLRLIERIGIRRQQVFATQADTVERLRNVAKLPELATAYMRREPGATPRGFARYLKAVADSGLPEDEAGPPSTAAGGRGADRRRRQGARVRPRVRDRPDAARMPGRDPGHDGVPDELLKERLPEDGGHEAAMRRRLYVAMTRAREGLVLSYADDRPSPFLEEARAAVDGEEERFEEELFGPGEGLHSTFRIMRDELLDKVSHVGGRLGEMRLDTGVDVSHAVARFLELVKVAALIDRSKSRPGASRRRWRR